MAWKKFAEKNYPNHLKSYNYELCRAVALCFPNILGVMALENINLSEDKTERLQVWSNDADVDFCHQSVIYAVSSVYFNRKLISYVHGQLFNFSKKITRFCLYLVLWTEFSTCQSSNLRRRWLDLYVIIIISSVFVIILQHLWSFFSCNFSFCHIFDTSNILSLT
jgi:hypothetical protein